VKAKSHCPRLSQEGGGGETSVASRKTLFICKKRAGIWINRQRKQRKGVREARSLLQIIKESARRRSF